MNLGATMFLLELPTMSLRLPLFFSMLQNLHKFLNRGASSLDSGSSENESVSATPVSSNFVICSTQTYGLEWTL